MSDPEAAAGDPRREWPVDLRGVTESVVATLGPDGRWNFAALGLRAPDATGAGAADTDGHGRDDEGDPGPVTARTWGETRTSRNFDREGGGVVQFTADPREFVDAALTVREADEPVLPGADAQVEVGVERLDVGRSRGTDWTDWALVPVDAAVRARRVPTINRGFNAVIEGTVAASRLDVPAHDADELLDRLAHLATVVERCGGPREREAWARIDEATDWRERARARTGGNESL